MKRKVVQHGPSTLIMSLPSGFVKKYGIKRGDEIECSEEGNSLVINTEKGKVGKEITLDVSDLLPRLVDRFLARSYQKGYDNILMTFNDPAIMKTIQDKVVELLGFEVMEQSKNKCRILSLARDLELDFPTLLRKAFLVLDQVFSSLIDAYKNREKAVLESLYLRDIEVNKFCYFCLRHINKTHNIEGLDNMGTHVLYFLIESLEDMGDELKSLSDTLAKVKTKDKEMLDLLNKTYEIVRIGYEFFYTPTVKDANKSQKLYNEIKKDIDTLIDKKKGDEIKALFNLKIIASIAYHIPSMRLDTLIGLKKKK